MVYVCALVYSYFIKNPLTRNVLNGKYLLVSWLNILSPCLVGSYV
jgi:hypothetical protein